MCVIMIEVVFSYFNLYVSTLSLMLVHTCIILVSMYLHCYSEFNVSPHIDVQLTIFEIFAYSKHFKWTLSHQIGW